MQVVSACVADFFGFKSRGRGGCEAVESPEPVVCGYSEV
jgi:hypothetical protein